MTTPLELHADAHSCFSWQCCRRWSPLMYFNIVIKWILSVLTSSSCLTWKVKFCRSRIDNKYVHDSNSSVPINNTKLCLSSSTPRAKPMTSPERDMESRIPRKPANCPSVAQNRLPGAMATKPVVWNSQTPRASTADIGVSHSGIYVHSPRRCLISWVAPEEFHHLLSCQKTRPQE